MYSLVPTDRRGYVEPFHDTQSGYRLTAFACETCNRSNSKDCRVTLENIPRELTLWWSSKTIAEYHKHVDRLRPLLGAQSGVPLHPMTELFSVNMSLREEIRTDFAFIPQHERCFVSMRVLQVFRDAKLTHFEVIPLKFKGIKPAKPQSIYFELLVQRIASHEIPGLIDAHPKCPDCEWLPAVNYGDIVQNWDWIQLRDFVRIPTLGICVSERVKLLIDHSDLSGVGFRQVTLDQLTEMQKKHDQWLAEARSRVSNDSAVDQQPDQK